MSDDHDWHLFDEPHNLEVRRVDDSYEVRPVGDPGGTVTMTATEFDRFRATDPDGELVDLGEEDEFEYGGES